MTSTYLITSGEYSDYRVHCVVPTREAAEAICAHLDNRNRYSDYDVEEIELVSTVAEYIAGSTSYAFAWVDGRGVIRSSHADESRGALPRVYAETRLHGDYGPCAVVSVTCPGAPERARHAVTEYATELASELAAGIPIADAVAGFNDRYAGDPK